ncbi:terminase [Rhodococcoides fascians]|uniref:terminase n=1 Tax=Rhodococcoides fascians TaxID=1828 RepID=UPI0037A5A10B
MASKKTPAGLNAAGAKLWKSVVDEYELDEHESALLLEAARTVDQLNLLQDAVTAEGVVIESPQGAKAHPALVEARQQRITLARIISALRLPDEETGKKPQQRTGTRKLYTIRPGA